ncbi:MAG: hypothetical protein IJS69_01200, partial [Selenomonadaceae bacterium]|nr:hypothetical protein [Selenomonadaceae bacterium]
MKLSQRKLIKKLLLATFAATSLTWGGGGCNVVHADADFESPDNPSNNTIEVNANSYTLNGTTFNYSGWFGQSYGSLYGGYALSGDVSGNTFTFNGGNIRGISIYGGFSANGNVSNNVLNFNGGNFSTDIIAGGWMENPYGNSGNVTGNTVNIGSGANFSGLSSSSAPRVIGGQTTAGNANNNTVNISGGTFSIVYGGFTNNGNANNNTVNISGGTSREAVGGFTFNGDAKNNTVNISGGTITGGVLGGMGNGEFSGNTINISGGTIRGYLYGDTMNVAGIIAGSGENARNNFINIWGNPSLEDTGIDGGGKNGKNTLNLATSISTRNVSNFDALNFFIPASMTSGGTMLTLTDTSGTDLSGTAI